MESGKGRTSFGQQERERELAEGPKAVMREDRCYKGEETADGEGEEGPRWMGWGQSTMEGTTQTRFFSKDRAK